MRAETIRSFLPYRILAFLFLVLNASVHAQQRVVTGSVSDIETKKPLFSCSVYSLTSGNGVITDENGKFTFLVDRRTDTIAISMIGYKTEMKALTRDQQQTINFEAVPNPASLGEVVVAIKVKYTKAQRLVKNVIEHKDANDVFNNSSFQAKVYDKIEVDLKNIPEKLQKNRLMKPFDFVFDAMDTTADNQKVLPVYLSESSADFYFKKNPVRERYDYTAIKSSGFTSSSMLTYIDGLYKRINVYDNNVKLVDVNFISPIADNALNYYKYHILDTLYFSSHRCIQVQFEPAQFGTNTFNGYMWIADTSYALKGLVMHMDKNANVNFVNKFELSQFFEPGDQGKFYPEKNILYMDLSLPGIKKKMGAIAKKTTLYKNSILNNPSIDTAFNKKPVDASMVINDSANWNELRQEPLSNSEKFVYHLMDTLVKIPAVVTYGKIISALSDGYYTAGHVDIGNIYSFYTNNFIEGNRFNFGLKTNRFFNSHVQLKGYLGYATKDEQVRYLASSLFVLNPKAWSTLKISLSNDLYGTYDHEDELDQNSLFASFLRRVKSHIRLVNSNEADITLKKYFDNGVGFFAKLNHSVLSPYFNVYYSHDGFLPYVYSKPGVSNNYRVNEASLSLRLSHKEKFITQYWRRGSLSSDYPIVILSYTKGIKVSDGLLKSDFDYSKWNFNLEHNITDGRIGRLSYTIDAGLTNGILPVVLLDVQKGNDTYYYNKYAFNNMNRYEFATDKFVSLALQQTFGSFPFKYIPVLRKANWRSLVSFKGVYGNMSEANKIANGFYDPSIDYHFSIPSKIPYMEAGAGIANILHFIRIDAIWRLTYLNNPGISTFGLKGSLELKF